MSADQENQETGIQFDSHCFAKPAVDSIIHLRPSAKSAAEGFCHC
jgi:hypothetical protein